MATPTTDDLKKIANLYVALFNRVPDTAGLSFWSSALANGISLSTIAQGFLSAPEGLINYPGTQGGETFIKAFYQTVFGRVADDGGLQFWLAALNSAGGVGSASARAAIVLQIANIVSTPLTATEAALSTNSQTLLDRALFANKIDYGLYLATQTSLVGISSPVGNLSLSAVTTDPASVVVLKAAAVIAQNNGGSNGVISPTTPINDVFSLTDTQLASTSIDGGTGFDTLFLSLSGDLLATPANVVNVEQIILYTAVGAPATVNVDVLRFSGATSITGASTSNLIFNNLNTFQTGVVNGKDPGNLPLANGNSTFFYQGGVTNSAITLTGGITTGTVSAFGTNLATVVLTTSTGPNNITGLALGAAVTNLSIGADTALTIGAGGVGGGVASALSLTVSGTGRVDFGSVRLNPVSVNAAGSSGGIAIRINGDTTRATTVVGSSVADTVRLYSVFGANSNINLGGGDDTLAGEGATFGAGSVVDGGAGNNTLSFYAVGPGNGAVFQNFQILGVTANTVPVSPSVDLATLTGTGITSLVLAGGGVGGANILNVTQDLTVTGAAASPTATTTLGVIAPALNDYGITFNATASGAPVEAGIIAIASVVGLTIASGGASTNTNKITLSDAALQTLTINGAAALQLAFSTATTATSAINASAASGLVTLDTTNVVAAGGGLTITAGSGGLAAIVAQKATVVAGAGADSITLKNAGVTTTSLTDINLKLVTITGFAGGDKVVLGSITGAVATTVFSYSAGGAALDVAVAAAIIAATATTPLSTFQLGTDTYIAADIDHSGTFTAGDVVVKLTGLVSLAGATVLASAGSVAL